MGTETNSPKARYGSSLMTPAKWKEVVSQYVWPFDSPRQHMLIRVRGNRTSRSHRAAATSRNGDKRNGPSRHGLVAALDNQSGTGSPTPSPPRSTLPPLLSICRIGRNNRIDAPSVIVPNTNRRALMTRRGRSSNSTGPSSGKASRSPETSAARRMPIHFAVNRYGEDTDIRPRKDRFAALE